MNVQAVKCIALPAYPVWTTRPNRLWVDSASSRQDDYRKTTIDGPVNGLLTGENLSEQVQSSDNEHRAKQCVGSLSIESNARNRQVGFFPTCLYCPLWPCGMVVTRGHGSLHESKGSWLFQQPLSRRLSSRYKKSTLQVEVSTPCVQLSKPDRQDRQYGKAVQGGQSGF